MTMTAVNRKEVGKGERKGSNDKRSGCWHEVEEVRPEYMPMRNTYGTLVFQNSTSIPKRHSAAAESKALFGSQTDAEDRFSKALLPLPSFSLRRFDQPKRDINRLLRRRVAAPAPACFLACQSVDPTLP
jgi:hypothetical protein